jgi:hypothetical protein
VGGEEPRRCEKRQRNKRSVRRLTDERMMVLIRYDNEHAVVNRDDVESGKHAKACKDLRSR